MQESEIDVPPPLPPPEVAHSLIKAHAIAALCALLISALIGLFISAKMHLPDMAGSTAMMTWGRLRYDHTQGIFFGWLGNAFLLFLYHAVPRLANRPVLSKKLGWALFVLWNFVVLIPGWALVLAGQSQPLEWAEFPLIIDLFIVLAFVLSIFQFVVPLIRANLSKLYVSGWYVIGGLIFTALAYPVGNLVPQLVPGAQGAAFSGLWIHDAIGLYVTPLALAISYWIIPVITKRPIYSHFLSMVGFWLLFFVYPLNGTHHYVFSAIPMDAQVLAITASALLGIDVILVVSNLLLSLKGSGNLIKEDLPLRFIWMGTIFYLIVSLQGAMQAFMPVNKLVHFSDWVIGHSHLAMIGFASFTAIGGIAHAWERVPSVKFNRKVFAVSYWLLLIGVIFMVVDLSILGLLEANIWQGGAAWMDSVRIAKPFWLARTISGVLLILGFFHFLLALCTGKRNDLPGTVPDLNPSLAQLIQIDSRSAPSKWLNMAYLSASVAGVGFFIFSFSLLGIAPGMAIEKDLKASKPATMLPLTASEERGRNIYAREGCAYCHTQQVRTVESDVERFGVTTRAWETIYDYPQLWGTRRIGPDLAREAKVRSDDWQFIHLYNPRLVVKDSVMPPFPWLFKGTAKEPSQEALDLIAYMKSLGRARTLAALDGQAIPPYCDCPEEIKQLELVSSSPLAMPNMAKLAAIGTGANSKVALPGSEAEIQKYTNTGAQLFAQNCAVCHGTGGRGDGEAAKTLLPKPADLVARHLSVERINFVLNNGVYGTSMPAWRDLNKEEQTALIVYLQTLPEQGLPVAKVTPQAMALFVKNCSSCHGSTGEGNGPAAAALAPRPTNFHEDGPGVARALVAITQGVPGSSMPPWNDQLTLQERAMLAAYVASMYR